MIRAELSFSLSADFIGQDKGKTMEQFTLRSPALKPDEIVPKKFVFNGMGCNGENISPPLEWKGFPEGTKSFVLTVVDPDASTDGGWRHWILANIPPNTTSLEEGASTKGLIPDSAIEIENDFEKTHYGGPCPPKGDQPHRYVFTVYAINTDHLNLDAHSDRASVETLLNNNSIGKASFTVRYGRKQ
jgi:Raf kinase inhibitor-like YbhB/YbcL family protein